MGISLTIDGSKDSELRIKGLEGLVIRDWREEGLDCNLDRMGKTERGELKWDHGELDLLDPQVTLEDAKELARLEELDPEDEGEYVDIEELDLLEDTL